jgi:hypothetical protein
MKKEQDPGHVSPQTETPKKLKNNSIWPDGAKPADEDVALEHCKDFFGELMDAMDNEYHGEEDFHPIKIENPPASPSEPTAPAEIG